MVLACRFAAAGIFLLSFASKASGRDAYAEFVASVKALRVLPLKWIRPAARAAIAAEACVVLLVALPFGTAAIGFGVAIGLLTVFTWTIVIAMRRGTQAPCRCFGASTTPLGLPHVIRNLMLLAVCVAGLVGSTSISGGEFAVAEVVISAGVAAIGMLFVLRMDDIVALFRSEPVAGRVPDDR